MKIPDIPLPAYIDQDAWLAFMEMRKAKKCPNLIYAQRLVLYEVQRLKDAGYDPNECIRRSIIKGYTDVWPATEKEVPARPVHEAAQTAVYLASRAEAPQIDQAGVARIKEELRRVKSRVMGGS